MKPISLPVLPRDAEAPAYVTTAASVRFAEGFHGEEQAQGQPFQWMAAGGRITFAAQECNRFLELSVLSHFHDLSQRLRLECAGAVSDFELLHGWDTVSLPVSAGADAARLVANKPFPPEYYPADGRVLTVQVRAPFLHADPERHAHIARQHGNGVASVREMLDGHAVLRSTPRLLGVDVQGACNVKPPCVYCAWDINKALEGDNVDLPFTVQTLGEYGEFFDNTAQLVNCSIGEPFMMRNLDELLDVFGHRGKAVEITTNGQILTDRNIQKLLGRPVRLYVSLDAATEQTYARLRSDGFSRVVANVRRLVAAKGGRGKPPLVYLVFMPMKANVHEADLFVRLCAELGVDRLVLRPLNDSEGLDLNWDRAGYRFEYQKELLPFAERVRVSGRVAELCERLGVPLADQMNFGGALEGQFAAAFAQGRREAAAVLAEAGTNAPAPAATPAVETAQPASPPPAQPHVGPASALPPLGDGALPACTEPWSSLYILRRGIMPCCYGGAPIAPMKDFRQAWNSPLLQAIRGELLQGRFHTYCLDSPDCPIVRKSEHARALSARDHARLRGRRLWHRWARSGFGIPGRTYRFVKKTLQRALG